MVHLEGQDIANGGDEFALTELTQVQQGSATTQYTYDANGNRATMGTSAGTTTYTYNSADVELTNKHDPNGKVTNYTYDANGNLKTATYDPTGANQTTTYSYDKNNRLTGVTEPNGTTISFSYDADGNRVSKTVTSGGVTTTTSDVYALGHLSSETVTTGSSPVTLNFTYDTSGTPASVVVASANTTPRYYYVYNGHGDVVALVDSSGASVASYSYDEFGNLTSSNESGLSGWSNPYRYDGAEGVRYDPETGLYWMSVRAYDPTLGRFISHDPLGRLAAEGLDTQPYVYAASNPVNKTDPTGLFLNRAYHDMDDGAVNARGCRAGVYTSGCPAPTGVHSSSGGGRGPRFSRPHNGGGGSHNNPSSGSSASDGHYQNARWVAILTASNFASAAGSIFTIGSSFIAAGLYLARLKLPWTLDLFFRGFFKLSLLAVAANLIEFGMILITLSVEAAFISGMFASELTHSEGWWNNNANLSLFFLGVQEMVDSSKQMFAFEEKYLPNSQVITGIDQYIPGADKYLSAISGPHLGHLLADFTNDHLFQDWIDQAYNAEWNPTPLIA